MKLLTSESLHSYLTKISDALRSRLDVLEYGHIIGGLLLLKRASDQPGYFTCLSRRSGHK